MSGKRGPVFAFSLQGGRLASWPPSITPLLVISTMCWWCVSCVDDLCKPSLNGNYCAQLAVPSDRATAKDDRVAYFSD